MRLSEQVRDREWELNACIMLLHEDPETFWSFDRCFEWGDEPDDFLEAWR